MVGYVVFYDIEWVPVGLLQLRELLSPDAENLRSCLVSFGILISSLIMGVIRFFIYKYCDMTQECTS
jgi:hypothetical protein